MPSVSTRTAAIAFSASLLLILPGGALSKSEAGTHSPVRVHLATAPPSPSRHISISVTGISVSSLQAQLAGASNNAGRRLRWRSLVYRRGVWRGQLAAPALLGIYPVRLRVSPGSPIGFAGVSLRALQPGTADRPGFGTPEGVAHWWVQKERAGATLVALKRWPTPAFDLRDPRLYQLLVLAYSPHGRPALTQRLGIFVTAFRTSLQGRWRLLETTVLP
jgi:hypothetical protein